MKRTFVDIVAALPRLNITSRLTSALPRARWSAPERHPQRTQPYLIACRPTAPKLPIEERRFRNVAVFQAALGQANAYLSNCLDGEPLAKAQERRMRGSARRADRFAAQMVSGARLSPFAVLVSAGLELSCLT
jgi:hypothetical protein